MTTKEYLNLIDEVNEIEEGKRVVATKYIKEDDFWFKGHLLEIAIYAAILFFASVTFLASPPEVIYLIPPIINIITATIPTIYCHKTGRMSIGIFAESAHSAVPSAAAGRNTSVNGGTEANTGGFCDRKWKVLTGRLCDDIIIPLFALRYSTN